MMSSKEFSGDGLANLTGMSKSQLYDIMSQMKTLIEQNQQQARQILVDNPLLTRALFQAQIILGMVQPSQAASNSQPQTSEPPQLPAQKAPQSNIPAAQSFPSQLGSHEQENITQIQLPVRKQQGNQSSTPVLSSPAPGLQHQSKSLQSLQHQVELSSPRSLSHTSQALNMPSQPPQQPAAQPSQPLGHLQRPMQTAGMPHLPLQSPLPSQHRQPLPLSHQLQSQMGPNMSFQHPGLPQPHHSQPPFQPNVKPPGAMGSSFPHGQPPLPGQLPPQSLYQGGGPHLGPDFGSQGGNSMQIERGSNWPPGLMEVHGGSQLPGPSPLGRGPMNLSNQPPRPPHWTPDMEHALQQVMSLTTEQINLLPPEQRHQVLQLQQMLRQ